MTLSNRWLWLLGLGGLPLFLAGSYPGFVDLTIAWYGVLVTLALTDYLLYPDFGLIEVAREVERRLPQNRATTVRITVTNQTWHPITLELQDTPPDSFCAQSTGGPFQISVPAQDETTVEYPAEPRERGDFSFGDVYLRIRGRLGLTWRLTKTPQECAVGVYPAVHAPSNRPLSSRPGRLHLAGTRTARVQGAGRDFESLREYLPNDEMRQVDWKATARHGKLISRQYDIERSQSIIICIDAGRTMIAPLESRTKMDYAVEAALSLAYAAVAGDDHVGLMVFSNKIETFLAPRRGRAQTAAVLEALHVAQPTTVESDYFGAFTHLKSSVRRRSLVVCFTDLWDTDSSQVALEALATLQPRHLVTAVTPQDTTLVRIAEEEVRSEETLFRKAVALQMLRERRDALRTLKRRGVLVVNAPADQLSVQVIDRYVRIKERMML